MIRGKIQWAFASHIPDSKGAPEGSASQINPFFCFCSMM